MTRLRLRPEGPFALATSIRFLEGFTPAADQSEYDQTLDLAFPLDDRRPVSAPLRRRGPRSLSHTFPASVVP
jgi:DNA-3-methyladenine glycosylase II